MSEKLILKLAKKTGWGYCRILGELKKLAIESLTRNAVKNILKRNGFDNGPKRGSGTWDDLNKRHATTKWQCDLFSKKITSKTGLRDIFGHKHMDVLCSQYRDHYHAKRIHQGLDNELIENPDSKKRKKSTKPLNQLETIRLSDIRCLEWLGGLLKSYFRKAA